LVMVNHGEAVCTDVKALESAIIQGIEQQFGVVLEAEPIYWD
jgi:UDP-N-acetylenolpyruvoylglucosamine reductase